MAPASTATAAEQRGRARWARTYLAAANLLTLLRLLLVPVVVRLLLVSGGQPGRQRNLAIALLALQQATDVADGYLARRARRLAPVRNLFGAVLDPVADKLFLNGAYVALALVGQFPWWAAILFITKELVLIGGWAWLAWRRHEADVRPNVFGKAAEALQALLVFAVLLELPEPLVSGCLLAAVAAVLVALAMYARAQLLPRR